MKTIEQRSAEIYNSNEFSFVKEDIEELVRLGAEFAQRWIPVTEEPEVNEFGFTEELLTKDERRYILQKGYKNKKGNFSWCDNNFVTHWRPIEVK